VSNLFSLFQNSGISFTKLKYNESKGLLKEYMTQLKSSLFIPEYLPTLDIFKLSMLNKSFKHQIDFIISPLSYADIHNYNNVAKANAMISKCPDISKFNALAILKEQAEEPLSKIHICNDNLKFYRMMENVWTNGLYGGSVFEGIKTFDPATSELRTLNNSLLESIILMRNDNAGFY
jgi:hypothetical protein